MWQILCVALVCFSQTSHSDALRVRRADDTAPLETVVSQLSQKLDTLTTQCNQQQAEIGELCKNICYDILFPSYYYSRLRMFRNVLTFIFLYFVVVDEY